MRPQFRTCSPFCFSCKLSNPLYFYLFYFFPLSSSLIPLCLPPHSLLLRWLSQPTGRAPAASCPPRFPSIPPPPPLPVQASTTSRRYPNLSSSPDLSSCCLLSFLCFIYLFFCSLVWVYKSNCAPLDLRRISTCPYLWMMMILLVNQCRLLAPAATLPSSFFFSLRSDTQKFYTSAAFHLHSQCHLFSITHSLSLFLKALANRATTPFAAWEWHKQNREIIFLLTISSLFPGLLFLCGMGTVSQRFSLITVIQISLLKGKKSFWIHTFLIKDAP